MKIIRAKDYKDMSRKAANIISPQVYPESTLALLVADGREPDGGWQSGYAARPIATCSP